ncbi:hypothetical protein Fcan01_00854 [Folsomia candida]|uniref:Uncharacterized protein n=1 Tax=Folsomia candida TaxID=158441 RepID=A0A226F0H2_FOLCA|nr:hypothetical protein Fcan01_00854 [Folsomia candida]
MFAFNAGILQVLARYDKCMQRYISRPIVEWNVSLEKITYRKGIYATFWWHFNLIFIIGITGIVGVGVLLFSQLHGFVSWTPLPILFLHVIILFLAMFGFLVGIGNIIHGEEFVGGWNALFAEYARRKDQELRTTKKLRSDPFWIVLTVIVYQFTFYPFILVPAFQFLKVDHRAYLVDMTHLTWFGDIIGRTFAFYTLLVAIWEICRCFPQSLILILTAIKMMKEILKALTSSRNRWRLNALISEYVRLFVIFQNLCNDSDAYTFSALVLLVFS